MSKGYRAGILVSATFPLFFESQSQLKGWKKEKGGASEMKRVAEARAAAAIQAQGTKAREGGQVRGETQRMEATE
jgi:hypothetical protein